MFNAWRVVSNGGWNLLLKPREACPAVAEQRTARGHNNGEQRWLKLLLFGTFCCFFAPA